MDKKPIFRQIIADFIEQPPVKPKPRDLDLPLDVPKIVSIIGPRRSGKTYLLFDLIHRLLGSVPVDRLVYINFEDDRLFPIRLEDMDELVQAYFEMYPENRSEQLWFFFDEIQEVPNWEKFIRRLWDSENCRIYSLTTQNL